MSELIMPDKGHERHCSHCDCGHDHDHRNHDHGEASFDAAKDEELAQAASETRAVYRVLNMDCPMEEALIRKKLATVRGVRDLSFNLMQRVLTVDHDPGARPAIESALKAIDMAPEALEAGAKTSSPIPTAKIPWVRLAWAGFFAALSELTELLGNWGVAPFGVNLEARQIAGYPLAEVLPLALALVSIALGGLTTFKKGWLAISNFNLNINALMAVAVTGAVLIGQFPEAAMVMVLFNVSEAIEAKALDRARNAIKDLMSLSPDLASVRQEDGSWKDMEPARIPLGSIIRARPGQKIALDGVVVAGESTINQAPITGESAPAEKMPGDPVFAGTINQEGSLEYKTTAAANDTTLARIIHAVEEAQATRAPMQRFVDVFARYYTPAVFILALLWAIVPPLVFGTPWKGSIYTGLVLLVIGCPCALVISTPVTIVSGMAAATRKGVLIKGGLYLELGRRLRSLALDKTGTITHGEPKLTDFAVFGDFPEVEARRVIAGLAGMSDHPVSRAIAEAELTATPALVEGFTAIPGKGVEGVIDGKKWKLGNLALAESAGFATPELREALTNFEKEGKTAVALIGEKGAVAAAAAADTVKTSSAEAIKELKALGVKPVMLTGDNEHVAAAIAAETGVTDFRANLLPQDKLDAIENLANSGEIVGMVGDGINDAPALAKAHVGFAMGGAGTDTAIETADVAIMDDDLRKIPRFLRLSSATHAILIENIVIALAIKAVFFGLTLAGEATMWMAVFADVGAALIVVANGLRVMTK